MIYRKLDKLTKQFRGKVELFMEEVGSIVFITESYRSQERQQELWQQGRYGNKGPIVTWTTDSNHTKGTAIDIAFKGVILYPNDFKQWEDIGIVAEKYGINWGWYLWKTDKPHFQDNGQPLNYQKEYIKTREDLERENKILRRRAEEATKILNPNL